MKEMSFHEVFTLRKEQFAALSDEEMGKIARAVIGYLADGIQPDFDGNRFYLFVWSLVKGDIERFVKKDVKRKRTPHITMGKLLCKHGLNDKLYSLFYIDSQARGKPLAELYVKDFVSEISKTELRRTKGFGKKAVELVGEMFEKEGIVWSNE